MKKTMKSICSRCGEEYEFRKKKGLKYNSCRKCTIYLSNLKARKENRKKMICITCGKSQVKKKNCPHCKKIIGNYVRCSKCLKLTHKTGE